MPKSVVITGQGQNEKDVEVLTKDGRTSLSVVSGLSDSKSVHLCASTASALIAYMLVDLSDTVNWKHTETGEVIVSYVIIEINPDLNFLGEIKIGYLTNVDATNGDFNQIIDIDMERKSDILTQQIYFGSHGIHCSDIDHFGPVDADSTLFQTNVDLGGPDDPSALTHPSGNGDLVMIVDGDGINTVGVSVTIGYETVVQE